MPTASSYFNARPVGTVHVVEFSRRDVTDAAYIKELGDDLYRHVKTLDPPRMVVDLEKVEQLSSAALGMLIALHKVIKKRQGRLGLAGMNDDIREVFKITNFHKIMPIFDGTRDAVADLEG